MEKWKRGVRSEEYWDVKMEEKLKGQKEEVVLLQVARAGDVSWV